MSQYYSQDYTHIIPANICDTELSFIIVYYHFRIFSTKIPPCPFKERHQQVFVVMFESVMLESVNYARKGGSKDIKFIQRYTYMHFECQKSLCLCLARCLFILEIFGET